MKSDNVTVTQGRMKQAFSNSIGQIVKNETTKIGLFLPFHSCL